MRNAACGLCADYGGHRFRDERGRRHTNPETKQKIGHVFADEKIMPRFAILNPKYTLTLPHYQMVAGIYDIFNHICEQYFSGEDDNTCLLYTSDAADE